MKLSKLTAALEAFPLVSEAYLSPFNTLLLLVLCKAATFPAEPNELTSKLKLIALQLPDLTLTPCVKSPEYLLLNH